MHLSADFSADKDDKATCMCGKETHLVYKDTERYGTGRHFIACSLACAENARDKKDMESIATQERGDNAKVDVDLEVPSIAIELSDGEKQYYEGKKAREILDAIPEWINEIDYLLAGAVFGRW